MDELLKGLDRFQSDVFPQYAELFAGLAGQQSPKVMFITCSDSRVDPTFFTQQLPGELFVARNAGNIVPAATTQDLNPDGVASAIEFAVGALEVDHIVVCGHSNCGAMKAALNPDSLTGTRYLRSWIEHSRDAVRSSTDDLNDVIRANVELQLEHLRSYPMVADRVHDATLSLHGWVYDIGTGHVAIHDGQHWT